MGEKAWWVFVNRLQQDDQTTEGPRDGRQNGTAGTRGDACRPRFSKGAEPARTAATDGAGGAACAAEPVFRNSVQSGSISKTGGGRGSWGHVSGRCNCGSGKLRSGSYVPSFQGPGKASEQAFGSGSAGGVPQGGEYAQGRRRDAGAGDERALEVSGLGIVRRAWRSGERRSRARALESVAVPVAGYDVSQGQRRLALELPSSVDRVAVGAERERAVGTLMVDGAPDGGSKGSVSIEAYGAIPRAPNGCTCTAASPENHGSGWTCHPLH